jgi:glycine cleavage system H protein
MKIREFTILEDRHYTNEHEWIKIEEKVARIGITDYAQDSLHEIVFIDLPDRERYVERMEVISTAESVKAVSEIFTPLSGFIVEVNESLALNPELVNQDPYGQGWIVTIQPSYLEKEKGMLLPASEYAIFLDELLTKESH